MRIRESILLVLSAVLAVAFYVSHDIAYGETDLPTNRPAKHPNQSASARPQLCGMETTNFGSNADWLCFIGQDGSPKLFPWYTIISGWGAASGRLCASMAIDGADIAIAQATGVVTDSAAGHANGKTVCPKTAADRPFTLVIDPYQFNQTDAVLRRDGVCVTDFDGGINAHTGKPCGDSDECHGGDGGTQLCVGGGADGGQDPTSDQIGTGRVGGVYVCMTAGALDDVCAE